ncbi:MAG TPA: stomatin-like protein [Spirochaetota bacterium]|jgi:regulator of protease activity HflC (stomatin/prohibitin superfamily)|nr:stomatin-like protein [Spirochaetota bacterium]HPM35217.1 stomatin-like protein [Spirochaetota bacterium]HPW52299.1 stomatin-like protein [Spirochaetota bacterium]
MEKVLIVALGFFAIVIFFKCVRVVPQAENWVVERLGKYVATLNPGLNLINPLLSKISKKVDIRERVLDMPRQGIITSDNAILEVDGVVYFKVMDPYKSFYGIQDLEWAIMNLAQTTLRSIMGKMTLDESLSLREKINKELLVVLDDATDSWGTKITRVELKDIAPPAELAKAMALQLKAERERRARVLEAEAKKEAAEKEAQGVKLAQILEAEARKEAAMRDAEARERLAEAEANAVRMVSESLKSTGGDPLVYLIGQEYVKGLTKISESQNAKFIMIPPDILETVKGIFGKK